MKSKKAAMEMSMGTIVTIVLLVSVLVLGLVFVREIFGTARGALEMTDDQISSEIRKTFGDDSQVNILPTSRVLEVKIGETDGIGVLIRNLKEGVQGPSNFTTEISVYDLGQCIISEEQAMNFVKLGRTGTRVIPVGGETIHRVTFTIPSGAPICDLRYIVNIKSNGVFYASDDFDLKIRA